MHPWRNLMSMKLSLAEAEKNSEKFQKIVSKLAEQIETKTQSKSKQGVRLRDLDTPNPDLQLADNLASSAIKTRDENLG